MIKENKTFSISCKCGNSVIVNTIKDAVSQGWKLISNSYPITKDNVKEIRCPHCEKKEQERMFTSNNIRERIQAGYYNTYPHRFKNDALNYIGILHHPKANVIFNKAYSSGHSSGHYEILNYLVDLDEFLTELNYYVILNKNA